MFLLISLRPVRFLKNALLEPKNGIKTGFFVGVASIKSGQGLQRCFARTHADTPRKAMLSRILINSLRTTFWAETRTESEREIGRSMGSEQFGQRNFELGKRKQILEARFLGLVLTRSHFFLGTRRTSILRANSENSMTSSIIALNIWILRTLFEETPLFLFMLEIDWTHWICPIKGHSHSFGADIHSESLGGEPWDGHWRWRHLGVICQRIQSLPFSLSCCYCWLSNHHSRLLKFTCVVLFQVVVFGVVVSHASLIGRRFSNVLPIFDKGKFGVRIIRSNPVVFGRHQVLFGKSWLFGIGVRIETREIKVTIRNKGLIFQNVLRKLHHWWKFPRHRFTRLIRVCPSVFVDFCLRYNELVTFYCFDSTLIAISVVERWLLFAVYLLILTLMSLDFERTLEVSHYFSSTFGPFFWQKLE